MSVPSFYLTSDIPILDFDFELSKLFEKIALAFSMFSLGVAFLTS